MKSYIYALIRYIADARRMEPRNIGVIVIADGETVERLDPNLAKRKDVNTEAYRAWRELIRRELHAPDTPLFRPSRTSSRFLAYLDALQEGSFRISTPLIGEASFTNPESLADRLFIELVATPSEDQVVDSQKPAGRYRQLEAERNLRGRGLKSDSFIRFGSRLLFQTHRLYKNGAIYALDKVEIGRQLSQTGHDIERLPHVRDSLRSIQGDLGDQVRYALMVDPYDQPFSTQEPEEFEVMRERLVQFSSDIERLGASVFRTPEQVEEYVDQLDAILPR